MDVPWQKDPCTVTQLVEHFRESTGWSKHYRNLPCYCDWKPRGRYAMKKGRGPNNFIPWEKGVWLVDSYIYPGDV